MVDALSSDSDAATFAALPVGARITVGILADRIALTMAPMIEVFPVPAYPLSTNTSRGPLVIMKAERALMSENCASLGVNGRKVMADCARASGVIANLKKIIKRN